MGVALARWWLRERDLLDVFAAVGREIGSASGCWGSSDGRSRQPHIPRPRDGVLDA